MGTPRRVRKPRRAAKAPPPHAPLDLAGVRTYPLAGRKSQVAVSAFARPHAPGDRVARFLDGLPRVLAADTLRRVASDILRARSLGRPIVWGLRAHVLKVGLSPVLIDLMDLLRGPHTFGRSHWNGSVGRGRRYLVRLR